MRLFDNLRNYGQFEDVKVRKEIENEIRRNEINAELFNFGA